MYDKSNDGRNMNSPKVQAAMKRAIEKMSKWPRWYFRFQLWRHRNGSIARMLKDTGAIDLIIKRMNEK